MKSLIIAEKPSVAKDIAKVLNCNKKGNSFFYNEKYIISWTVGHLVTLLSPEEYNPNLKKWDIENLPIIPTPLKIKPIDSTFNQLQILRELINSDEVFELICATDSGREGELIFRYVYQLLNCKKPFKRLWISSMTDEAIKNGFDNLKNGNEYDNLFKSAKARADADWLVGINSTRAFTAKFNTLLSIGRVQTPTLSMIVDRFNEIENFNIKKYFEIEGVFCLDNNLENEFTGIYFNSNLNTSKIDDENSAKNIIKNIENHTGFIRNIETETKKQPPPLLYDLTELQRECNKKFGYSAQKTLSIAQNLYEKRKLITYPRTDSRYLSDDMKSCLKSIIKNISNIDEYKQFTSYLLSLNSLPITKRIIDNSKISDHHAIILTNKLPNLQELSIEELNIYNLIISRFLAVFYPYYVYSITKITSEINSELFISKGTTVLEKGWTVLNSFKEKNEQEQILPNVKKGDTFNVIEFKLKNKKTKPPSHYTEASLLSAMENAGRFVDNEELKENLKDCALGTPATRASIIERLINVGYIERKGKSLIATKKGISLINQVPKELKSPETTGKWERGLNLIAKGQMQPEKFMKSIYNYVNFIVNYVKTYTPTVVFEDDNKKYKTVDTLGKCLNCSGVILENQKSFYCSNWKGGCNFSVWKNSLENIGINITSARMKKLLKDKKIESIKAKVNKNTFNGNLILTPALKVIFERSN